MIPILYKSAEVDFTTNGLGLLNDIYSVDIQEQRNGLLTLTASYPTNAKHYKEIETGRIIYAKPNPLDGAQAFRIVKTELDISGYNLNIEADHITYDLTHNLVKEIHLQGDGQNAMTHLQNATVTPHLFRFVSDLQHLGDSRLQYVNPMEAIAGTEGSILQIWGGELHRDNRTVSMLSRRGRDNFTTFRLGKNINGLKYTVDMSNVTTRIVPTVTKSDATDNDKAYFVVGDTVDSKNLNKYPNVYIQHVDMGEKVTINEGETDEQVKAKIDKQAKNWFTQSANTGIDLPQVTVEIDVTSLQDSADYQEKFRNLESVGLTDTVSVYVPEFNVNVTAIVNELHYDPVAERVTSLVVGTSKKSFADNNSNALAELQNSITQIRQDATTAIVSSNGKNTNYYGTEEPAHPVEGDLWFKQVGDETYLMIFKDGRWQEWVSTKTQEEIAKKVDDAVKKAKEYTDELNEKQAEEVQKFQSEANAALSSAAAERNSLASQADTMLDGANSYATSMADSAAAYGKAQASNVLSQAQSELAVAKQQLGSEVSKAQSDITATNKQLAGKVSQTDFDKTTGDLSTKYGQVKATADAVTTDVAKYKQSNDKKVSANAASIATMSDQITSKVSKTDFDKATGDLNGKFTQQKQTVDNISQTVTELQAKANSQGQVNQLMNTEFNPDLEGWYSYSSDGNHNPGRGYLAADVKATTVGFNGVDMPDDFLAYIRQDLTLGTNTSNGYISLRWQANTTEFANYGHIWLIFKDKNGTVVYNSSGKNPMNEWTSKKVDTQSVGKWAEQKWEGIEIPNEATSVTVSFEIRAGIISYLARPMLVFDDHIGDYVPGNYNNNARVAELEVGIDHITGLVNDPKKGLSATANLAANGLSVATKAQNDATTAIQTAKGVQTKVEQMGGINLLVNTEFNPDLEGWEINTSGTIKAPYRSYWQPDTQATTVGWATQSGSASSYSRLRQNVQLSSTPGSGHQISMSWYAYTGQTDFYNNLWVAFYDKDNKSVGSQNVKWATTDGTNPSKQNSWNVQNKWEGIDVPDTAVMVNVSFEAREGTSAYLSHPMLVMGSTIGDYIAGNYNNNNSLESTRTQLAGQITDETKNRENGDSAVTTQLTNLIDSRVKSVTSGYESAISQSADTIMASVSQPNQLLNTEFNPDLEGWSATADTGSKAPYRSYWNSYNQATTVAFNTSNSDAGTYTRFVQHVVLASSTQAGHTISVSWSSRATQIDNYANLQITFYDRANEMLENVVNKWAVVTDGSWNDLKVENITVPDTATNVRISFESREGTIAYLSHPMLVFGSTIGDTYMPGSYSGMNTSTVLELFKDNWALGIADNAGRLISGINGDRSGTVIQGKKLVINSDTTINGKAFIDGSVIKNASIGTAQIGKAAVGSAQIINVDVSKISGNIANFITGNISRLNSHVLYGDTGHLGTTDTGRVINKQDNHLQLASKGMYNSANDRAQVELLSHTNDIDANMRGSFNYYSDVRKGHGLGIRLVQNQILAIDEDGGSKNLYLSPYAGGQVRIVSRDLNSYYDIAAANFRVSSQRKFKSDIKPLDDGALDIVNKTNIKSYTKNGVSEIGVIADEAPNEVLSDDGKFINIYDYTSVLYKAVQELSAQVKELQNERPNN